MTYDGGAAVLVAALAVVGGAKALVVWETSNPTSAPSGASGNGGASPGRAPAGRMDGTAVVSGRGAIDDCTCPGIVIVEGAESAGSGGATVADWTVPAAVSCGKV
jgi:hypothetical protein